MPMTLLVQVVFALLFYGVLLAKVGEATRQPISNLLLEKIEADHFEELVT